MAVRHGQRYALVFRTRNLGYGIEEGSGDYIATDDSNLGGGQGFEAVDGSETIYLFDDEIVSIEESSGLDISDLDFAGQRLQAAHSSLSFLYKGANDEVRGSLDSISEIAAGLRGF